MKFTRFFGVKSDVELIFPANSKRALTWRCPWLARQDDLLQISGMGGDFIGYDASRTSCLFGKPNAPLGNVTEHGTTVPNRYSPRLWPR